MRNITLAVAFLAIIFGVAGCGLANGETYQERVVVLMYHHLDEEVSSSSTISPAAFGEHLAMLAKEGFNVIPLEQLGGFLAGKNQVPPKAVVITFDDGYRSNYEYAFPLLQEYGFPATIFMIVSRIGQETGEIPKLTWEQMLAMQAEQIDFQSHSFDGHYQVPVNSDGAEKPVLAAEIFDPTAGTKENPDTREARVYDDLKLSRELLEAKLGKPVTYFAAPYGWYDDVTIKAARVAGFSHIFTIKPGANTRATDPMRLYRVNAGSPDISAAELKKLILKAALLCP